MYKISLVDACLMATKAMMARNYKRENSINKIIARAIMKDKVLGTYSQYIEINENEKRLFFVK